MTLPIILASAFAAALFVTYEIVVTVRQERAARADRLHRAQEVGPRE